MVLPTPDVELIRTECREYDSDNYNRVTDEALRELREQFPRNTELAQVLLKVLVLNKLYSTRVNDIDVLPMAKHIVSIGIDPLLERGDPTAVGQIYTCKSLKIYYSFATKFCSWHNPSAYPIYDRYAEECLWAYRNRDVFADFKRKDLWYYDKVIAIVSAFRKHYGLEQFTFREIDKFLWRTGGRIVAKTISSSVQSDSSQPIALHQ